MTKQAKYYVLFLILMLSLLGAIPAHASDVSSADFWGIIRTTNNSTTASNVMTPVTGMNTNNLISAGFLNASAKNCAVQYSGSDIVFMPGYGSNPWCIFDGTIAEKAIKNYTFYTKGVSGGSIRYFPSTSGMTVPDSATLEPGSNFAISISAYFDAAQTGSVLSKGDYLNILCPTAGNIRATIGVINPISGNTTGLGANNSVPVTLPSGLKAGDLALVFISLYPTTGVRPDITTPGGWTQLYHSAYGAAERAGAYYKVLNGTETTVSFSLTQNSYYSYQSFVINGAAFTGTPVVGTTATGAASNPNPPSLTSGFGAVYTLWFAIAHARDFMASAPTSYSGLISNGQNSSFVSTGERYFVSASDDPGTFGTSSAAWAANTLALRLNPYCTVSTALSTGEHNVAVSADGTNLSISIDAGASTSSALSGVSVTDSANNFVICPAPVVCYMSSCNISVSGVLRGSWDWEYNSTFTDDSGNGNTGTPNFRTTSSDADVSSEFVYFTPTEEPEAPAFIVGAGPDFLSDNVTATANFTANITSSHVLNYPFKDVIDAVATAGGVPYQIPSTYIGTFVLVALSMLTSLFLRQNSASSLFAKSAVNIAGYGILVALKIYDWWMLVFFFIFEAAIWFAAKERRE